MGGTREGALKAAAKLKAKDPDYFKKLRAKVKAPANANGFDKDPERARSAGAKGGRKSRRGSTAVTPEAQAAQPDHGSEDAAEAVQHEGADT